MIGVSAPRVRDPTAQSMASAVTAKRRSFQRQRRVILQPRAPPWVSARRNIYAPQRGAIGCRRPCGGCASRPYRPQADWGVQTQADGLG